MTRIEERSNTDERLDAPSTVMRTVSTVYR